MWNVKTKVIPALIGVTGTISESRGIYLCNVPGKHKIKGTAENSHTGHCTHAVENAGVKVPNICHWKCLYM
jgi:hypothetical protein